MLEKCTNKREILKIVFLKANDFVRKAVFEIIFLGLFISYRWQYEISETAAEIVEKDKLYTVGLTIPVDKCMNDLHFKNYHTLMYTFIWKGNKHFDFLNNQGPKLSDPKMASKVKI
jgi:hypothetical protein